MTAPSTVPPAPVLDCTVTANPLGLDPSSLYGVARRHNAKRSALFVSLVLGKHVPAPPATVIGAGLRLAARVSPGARPDATVIAFAETATALGHLVRDGLDAGTYLHTTRHPVPGEPILAVEEAHSHATSHRLHHTDPDALAGDGPVILVDDELTTGNTMLEIIAAVHGRHPRERYVVAALLDWRGDEARRRFREAEARLGCEIEVVALLTGEVRGELVDGPPPMETPLPVHPPVAPASVHRIALGGPATARRGWGKDDQAALDAAVPAAADRVVTSLGDGPVLVLGTEELMYAPLRLARELTARSAGPVRFHSTTRSPVVVADVEGYPVRHGLRFACPDEPGRLSRVHNVAPGAHDDIVVVFEGAGHAGPMVAALASTGARVHLVELTP